MRTRTEALTILANALPIIQKASARARRAIGPAQLARVEHAAREVFDQTAKAEQSRYGWYDEDGDRQGGLIAFVRYFWHVLEPDTPFVDGWPLHAMIEHLEAVTAGQITRLLINIPPGFMKSLLTNVLWPAWEWGPMGRPNYRYVTFSYSASLTERDNGKFRDLVTSPEYQRLYGDQVKVRNKTTLKVHNSRTGWKLASSVGGVGTGERGDRILLDDPHNVKDAESETIRSETTRWFRESLQSRFNNEQTALVVIMQRVHALDVSGVITELRLPYTHLLIPMLYDWKLQTEEGRPRPTSIGWYDPRYVDPDDVGGIDAAKEKCDGILAWPARYSPKLVVDVRDALGPYAWAGQFQQQPTPRGGGIFKEAWWQLWAPDDGNFPVFDYMVASLDGAFTEKEERDPSALTVWGTFTLDDDPTDGEMIDDHVWHLGSKRRIMLVDAWAKHLPFSGPRIERLAHEMVHPGMDKGTKMARDARYRRRTMPEWGLIEWVRDTCQRFRVHTLLIEAKASGISAAQELRNRYPDEQFSIQLVQVKGDKFARACAAVPTFSNLLVYAPDRPWAAQVIEEMAVFPRSAHDDLTDSTTQAIAHLRSLRLAQTDEESAAEAAAGVMHTGSKPAPLYPV